MISNIHRAGNYTSSEIVALTTRSKDGKTFGAPGLTYILETNIERKLGRSISDEVNARPMTWGSLLEKRVFDILPLDYILSSTETDVHPTIPYWAGSKDGIKHDEGKTVIDIKAPFTLKSFCQLVDPLYDGMTGMDAINAVRNGYVDKAGMDHPKHKDGEKFYWQLVSNSVINNTQFAELIIYMPFKSEIDDVRLMAQNVATEDLGKHYFIAMASEDELPYLPDGGYYQNLNIIRFEVPLEDKLKLAKCVQEAGKLLIGNESMVVLEKPAIKVSDPVKEIKLTKLAK